MMPLRRFSSHRPQTRRLSAVIPRCVVLLLMRCESPRLPSSCLADSMSQALLLTTNLPEHMRQGSEESVSVIHAPQSFASWVSQSVLSWLPGRQESVLLIDWLYRSQVNTFLNNIMLGERGGYLPKPTRPVSLPSMALLQRSVLSYGWT